MTGVQFWSQIWIQRWLYLQGLLPLHILYNCCVLLMTFPLLSQRIDEDKLFNLFSIYGNIVRIKILRNKPDHALVQMSDGFQAELAVHFLKASFHYSCLCLTKAHCTPSLLLLLLGFFPLIYFKVHQQIKLSNSFSPLSFCDHLSLRFYCERWLNLVLITGSNVIWQAVGSKLF